MSPRAWCNGSPGRRAGDYLRNPRGATSVALIVTDGGDGLSYDHADWAHARFTCSSAPAGAGLGNDWDGLRNLVAYGATPNPAPGNYKNANFALMRLLIPRLTGVIALTEQTAYQHYLSYLNANVFAPAGVPQVTCFAPVDSAAALVYDATVPDGTGRLPEREGDKTPAPAEVAIVGMASILPGAPNLDAYWTNILNTPFRSNIVRINYANAGAGPREVFPMVVRFNESVMSGGIRFRF